MKNRIVHTGLAATLFIMTSGVCLADLPSYYPDNIPYSGMVGSISDNTIIIDASAYRLDPNVRVHTLSTSFGSIRTLSGSTPVGFTKSSDRSGNSVVTEIWVLPEVEQH